MNYSRSVFSWSRQKLVDALRRRYGPFRLVRSSRFDVCRGDDIGDGAQQRCAIRGARTCIEHEQHAFGSCGGASGALRPAECAGMFVAFYLGQSGGSRRARDRTHGGTRENAENNASFASGASTTSGSLARHSKTSRSAIRLIARGSHPFGWVIRRLGPSHFSRAKPSAAPSPSRTASRTRRGPSSRSRCSCSSSGRRSRTTPPSTAWISTCLTRGALRVHGVDGHVAHLRVVHVPAVCDRGQHHVDSTTDAVRHTHSDRASHHRPWL